MMQFEIRNVFELSCCCINHQNKSSHSA